jgi:hypothetical protein
MHFLTDLDGLTVTISVIALAVAWLYLVITAKTRPRTLGRPYGLPLAFAFVCVMLARAAYCPDADLPHIRVSGWMWPVQSYTYHSGKGSYTGLIACVDTCDTLAPRLALDDTASRVLKNGRRGAAVSVVYLGREESEVTQGGISVTANPVVEIDNLDNGARLFYRDTRRHWPRAILLLFDALMLVAAFAFCFRLRSRTGDQEAPATPTKDGARILTNS